MARRMSQEKDLVVQVLMVMDEDAGPVEMETVIKVPRCW